MVTHIQAAFDMYTAVSMSVITYLVPDNYARTSAQKAYWKLSIHVDLLVADRCNSVGLCWWKLQTIQ